MSNNSTGMSAFQTGLLQKFTYWHCQLPTGQITTYTLKLVLNFNQMFCSREFQLTSRQHIQNIACRIVCNIKKYDSITLHLKRLPWVKIQDRIIYKVATIMFKCLKGTDPLYLKLLLPVQYSRAPRSRTFTKVPVYRKNTSLAIQGSLTSVGSQIWNELPVEVRECTTLAMFKSKLKTFLYQTCLWTIILFISFISFTMFFCFF